MQHRGCALVACEGVGAAQAAAERLAAVEWSAGQPLQIERAVKIPSGWQEALYVLKEDLEARQAAEELKAVSAAHAKRRRRRRKEDRHGEVSTVLSRVPPPGGAQALGQFQDIYAATRERERRGLEEWVGAIDWAAMPAACQPGLLFKGAANGRQVLRAQRKRQQVASFALILVQLLRRCGADPQRPNTPPLPSPARPRAAEDGTERGARLTIVDFGSGSGNLALPLAWLFPAHDFVCVDMKVAPIAILRQRAKEGGLRNVHGVVGTIESYCDSADVVLALHACGNATDYALMHAERCRAPFVVSPCCVGKLKFSGNLPAAVLAGIDARGGCATNFTVAQRQYASRAAETGGATTALLHPRSRWMREGVDAADFEILARAADYSHTHERDQGENAVIAKANVELDRAMAAREAGFHTCLVKLLDSDLTTKPDVIIGAPAEVCNGSEESFSWPWR